MSDGEEHDGHDGDPHREEFHEDPVGHTRATGDMTVGQLVEGYGDAGIGAASVNEAGDVLAEMFANDDCTVFLSLAGAMVPAGMRRIVSDLIRDGYVDALVTTGANLTHDAIEAIGGKHHHGRTHDPEKSLRDHDEGLRDEGVDRIYNVYLPQEHFAAFEGHLREEVFPALEADPDAEGDDAVSIADLARELGRANAAVNERDDDLDYLCEVASDTVVRELIESDEMDSDEDIEAFMEDVSRFLLTIRDIERIGDHSVNIAARALYMIDNNDELIY